MAGHDVLVVEDDAGLSLLVGERLAELGYGCRVAATGRAALAALPADLLLLDYSLPDTTAAALIAALGPAPPPFLVMTGAGDERIAVEMMKLGALDYLVKDGRFLENLPAVVARALAAADNARRLAESQARLAESERLYRHLLENIRDAFYRADMQGRLLMLNATAAAQLGYASTAEMLGRPLADFYLHPHERERVFATILERGYVSDYPLQLVRKDGTTVQVSVSSHLWKDEDGQVLGVEGLIRDMTERHAAEERLRRSEDRFRSILGQMAEGFILVDRSLAVVEWNRAMERLTGLPAHDVVGRPYLEVVRQFLPPEARSTAEALAAKVEEMLATGDSPLFYQLHDAVIVDQAGRRRFLSEVLFPLHLDEGLMLGGVLRDETARRLAEDALRQSEQRYQALFDGSGDAILVFLAEDPDRGRLLSFNPAAARMHGYEPHELDGLSIQDLDAPGALADVDGRLARLIAGETLIFEMPHRRKDGAVFPVEVTSTLLEIGGRRCVMAIERDISERRAAETTRARLEAQLRQEQKLAAVGTLANGVAHEINNPLMGMINYAQLVHDRVPEEHAELRDFAREILGEGMRIAAIVRNLLAFSRQDQVTFVAERPEKVVDAILSLMGKLLAKQDIRVEVDLPAGLPAMRCSSPQIQQVLLNLLTNARDALGERFPKAHPDKRIAIRGRALADGNARWVRLTVEDGGHGIPESLRARIFDPFFTTKPRDQGTGLGLSISFGIVQEHGGRLDFESAPGAGTRFHLDLPAVGG